MSFFAALGLAAALQSGQVLTLDEALNLGVANSFKVRVSKVTEEKSRQTVKAAMASLGFDLVAKSAYTRYFNPIPVFGGGTQKDAKSADLTLSFGVDISRISRYTVRAAKFGLDADQAAILTEVNTLKQQIRAAYYSAVRAKWGVDIRQAAVQSTQERMRVGEAKKREGVLSQFDLLRIQTDLEKAKAELRNAENTLNIAKSGLNNALARDVATPFDLAEIGAYPGAKDDLVDLTKHALTTRPELKTTQARIEQLGLQAKIAQRGMKPSMNVALVHQRVIDPTPFQRDQNTIGQINFSFPIHDGGSTKAQVDIALKDQEAARLRGEELKQFITYQVQVALLNLVTAKEQMVIAEQNLTTAAEARRLADVRFANGLGVVLDTIQAQESLTASEAALANAKYQYLSAFADLQLALGDDAYAYRGASTLEEKK